MMNKIEQNQNGLIIKIVVFLSVSCVSASDEQPVSESAIPSGKEETFFNSEPVYRTVPLASFPKRQLPDKLMENVRGLYYIVDASGFVKADTDRSKEYRVLGSTVLVDETLLTGQTRGEKK